MAQKLTIRLRVHRATGRLCKTIGNVLGKDGTVKKKVWYFDPDDETAAVTRALELRSRWKALRSAGHTVWDEGTKYHAERTSGKNNFGFGTTNAPVTIRDAAGLYIDQLLSRHVAGQISEAHMLSQRARLIKAIKPFAMMPLSVVGELQIRQVVLWLAQRPVVEIYRPPAKQPEVNPKPTRSRRMSASYARAAIKSLKWFLMWCSETDQVRWHRPEAFNKIFRIHPSVTPEEHQRQLTATVEVDHFDLDELIRLWSAASAFQRCLLCLGLNCGFCCAECATLRTSEVRDLLDDTPVIERYRIKTLKTAGQGAFGRWHLWPETVSHLVATTACNNSGPIN